MLKRDSREGKNGGAQAASTVGLCALAAVTCLVTVGCGAHARAPSQRQQGSQRSDLGRYPGYHDGLSRVLARAETDYGIEVLTRFYDLGFVGGQVEGVSATEMLSDVSSESGCKGTQRLLLQQGATVRGTEAECKNLIRPEYAHSWIGGPVFGEGRAKTARKGAESGDPRVTEQILWAYEQGYAYGFVEGFEAGDVEGGVSVGFMRGCQTALNAEQVPPSELRDLVLKSCKTVATETARDTAASYRQKASAFRMEAVRR